MWGCRAGAKRGMCQGHDFIMAGGSFLTFAHADDADDFWHPVIHRDFPLENPQGEETGENRSGKSKVWAASHQPCIHARRCIAIAIAKCKMDFRLSVVM